MEKNLKNKTWELQEIATQTEKVFHNKEQNKTMDMYEAILEILNNTHDIKVSLGN